MLNNHEIDLILDLHNKERDYAAKTTHGNPGAANMRVVVSEIYCKEF